MYCYYYNQVTLEYIGSDTAPLDPEATKKQGREVYGLPAHSTFKKPPKINKFKAAVYDAENDDWNIVDDYRGEYIVNSDMNIAIVTNIGALPDGYVHITKEEADIIVNDPIYYIIQDGELVENPDYEEIKEQEEKERVLKLSITKYDFYKLICLPNGLGYQQVKALLASNDEIAAAWEFCERIYRGDELLNTYIKQFIPNITDEELDNIFKANGH